MTDTGFHDVLFPLTIALGASAIRKRNTEVITLSSGKEQRNSRWYHSRRRYQVGGGVKTRNDLERVLHFFEERRGQLYAFRFRDPLDNRSSAQAEAPTPRDQHLGQGDGNQLSFPLVKTYGAAPYSYVRPITRPVLTSLQVALDESVQEKTSYSVNEGGLIVFEQAPAQGVTISAGFLFDVPVRFASDELVIDLDSFGAGSVPDIPLIEVM